MKQEYVLLRTENDLLNSLIGQSFNNQTKFEAEKILSEIHSKAQDRSIGKMALCYVLDKNQVLGVGGSTLLKDKKGKIVSNLILDNFGEWNSGLFVGAPSGLVTRVLKDVTGTNRTVGVRSTTVSVLNDSTDAGGSVRIGSGTTPPTRGDFNVQTGFITAPESVFVKTTNPIWNSGLGNFKPLMSLTAGGSGTVNESVMNMSGKDSGGGTRGFLVFRDIISPAQPFIIGQNIVVEYTIQL